MDQKLNKSELIIQQASADVKTGKITTEDFSEIKKRYGNHKKFTKKEYLKLPILNDNDSDRKNGIYRKDDDKITDNWCVLYSVINKYASVFVHGSDFLQGPLMETSITIEIGEIIKEVNN